MAFSDVEKEKDLKRNVPRALDATNKRWSDKQKLEALQTWMALGNASMTARMLGIPAVTMKVWQASEWWKELHEEMKLQEKVVLSNNMKAIVKAAHKVVADRLEHGDAILNQKTGKIEYKPVAMRDAHRVAVDLNNQATVVERSLGSVVVSEEGYDGKLDKLAERFATMATSHIEKKLDNKRTVAMAEIVDVENKNA